MPALWSRKPSKYDPQPPKESSIDGEFNLSKSSIKFSKRGPNNNRNSCHDGSVMAPRSRKDCDSSLLGATAFSGFYSDSGQERDQPLPLPSVPSSPNSGISRKGEIISGSTSFSSFIVSECKNDNPFAQNHCHIYGCRRHEHGIKEMDYRNPSPSTGSSSPRPPLVGHATSEATARRFEDGMGECYKLPLPPNSPTSSSMLPRTIDIPVNEHRTGKQMRWKKGRLLGRGTFGNVYLGFNISNGHLCAIKEVGKVSDDHASRECLKQLNHEINFLSQLSHRNIVRYYGSEMGDEALSVYLEYLSGGSIHKLLQEYGPFEEPVIQNYTRQILLGLAYLHGKNTIHRDIKGANILVDPNGVIKLADFGMAKHITNFRSIFSFKGSPYWMAPEVVMNANGYSTAVDIWSLGCTILEMATSKPPWSEFEGVAAIFKIGNSTELPEIPRHLSNCAKSFINLCLQRDPSVRPAAEVLLDHPFVQDQMRIVDSKDAVDPFPLAFDRSPALQPLESPLNWKCFRSCNVDYSSNLASRALRSPISNGRLVTSLPVSPCSSPLQQNRPSPRSGYLSPPHLFCPKIKGSDLNLNNFKPYEINSNKLHTLDLLGESPLLQVQTPGGSPNTRSVTGNAYSCHEGVV